MSRTYPAPSIAPVRDRYVLESGYIAATGWTCDVVHVQGSRATVHAVPGHYQSEGAALRAGCAAADALRATREARLF